MAKLGGSVPFIDRLNFSKYILIFCKQVRITGEIVMSDRLNRSENYLLIGFLLVPLANEMKLFKRVELGQEIL